MRAERRTHPLALPLTLAVATQTLCAWVIGGRLHPDETHQYLEFAHRVAWGYGNRPHEFYSGMRNLAAPGALAGLLSLARALGVEDPRAYLALVHALVGLASLAVPWSLYAVVRERTNDLARARFAAFTLALWVPFANLAFRTLGETFSMIAWALALREWNRSPRHDARVGALLALGFVFRYPAGVAFVPFALAYLCQRDLRALARFTLGASIVIGLLGLLDALTWGHAWHSVFAYADYNLVRDRARLDYGARPPWFYLACTVAFAPFALLVSAISRKPSFANRHAGALGLVVAYLAVMSAIAHKEVRFFLPIVPFVVVAAVLARDEWSPRRMRWSLALTALQSVCVLAGYVLTDVCERDAVRAAESVGRRKDASALVMVGASHPGHVHLHRDIPVYGDARNHPLRALDALDRSPSLGRAGTVYLVCGADQREFCARELPGRAAREVERVGRATVYALRSRAMEARADGDDAVDHHAHFGPLRDVGLHHEPERAPRQPFEREDQIERGREIPPRPGEHPEPVTRDARGQ